MTEPQIPRAGHAAERLGYVCVAGAAGLWAASGTVAKFLFQNGLSALELVQLRTALSAAALALWLLLRNPRLLRIGRPDIGYFILLGLMVAVAQFTYLYAISRIHVAAAILLQYQAPLLVALYAVIFAGQRVTVATALCAVVAMLGCYLMVGGYRMDILNMNTGGILSGLASAVAFAAYSVKSEEGLLRHAPWTLVLYGLFFAALFWNAVHVPLSAFSREHDGLTWSGIVFVGILGTVVPFGLYNEGILRIRAARASITATLEPVIAGLIAYALLGEVLEAWQVLGGVLVLASVVFLQARQERQTVR